MSFEPQPDEEFGAVCPYLGLTDDADSHATYPTEAHRCYRLPNPTRIASHHQETYCLVAAHTTCPVYVGDEVPGIPRAPSLTPPPPVSPPPGVLGSAGAARQRPGAATQRSGGAATMPRPRRAPPGTLAPRPRPGGVSMPAATIGLFALAIVVVAIAFGITQLTGSSNNSKLPILTGNTTTVVPGGGTIAPGTGTATAPPSSTTTPPATGTASANSTATTPSGTGDGSTYTVQSGDTCYGIAQAQGVSLSALEQANPGKCSALNQGDVLTIPSGG